jgi:hypothetical protein
MYSFTRVWIEFPAGQDAQRHQEGGQDDEQHRNAVHAHLVGEPPGRSMLSTNWNPGSLGVEARPDQQRHHEGVAVVHKRDLTDVASADLVSPRIGSR